MKRRLLLVMETEAENDSEAHDQLDRFREAVLPAENFGVSLYRATHEDLLEAGLTRTSPPVLTWVKGWEATA